ncbi:MAG: hypothetical protein H6730_10710 [Deltaproteobacteria bacterium]|nr:hypothetical protein [Deltaproteobacteria bacterium]
MDRRIVTGPSKLDLLAGGSLQVILTEARHVLVGPGQHEASAGHEEDIVDRHEEGVFRRVHGL